jgi:hypothetical protein
MLAHLFSEVGDTFAHLYDYGDKWHHEIEVWSSEYLAPYHTDFTSIRLRKFSPSRSHTGVSRYSMARACAQVVSYISNVHNAPLLNMS